MTSTLPSSERARQAQDARRLRQTAVTREINQIPLTQIMEGLFGVAGEKSGPRHNKYWIDGVLFNVEREGQVFGALGRKFSCLKGKGGSAGAIDLVLAVKEAQGQNIEFKDAKLLLQRTFMPGTLEAHRPNRPELKIAVGDIDEAAWFRAGAVYKLVDQGKCFTVVAPLKNGGGIVTQECNEAGVPLPGAGQIAGAGGGLPRTYDSADAGRSRQILVRSASPLLPHGIASDDPGLLLIPFGPFTGLMLGQLDTPQLEALGKETAAPKLKRAIAETKPKCVGVGVNSPVHERRAESAEETPIELPEPLDQIELNGTMHDNVAIVRSYLIDRRKLQPNLVDAAMSSRMAYPTESVIYKRGPDGQQTGEVLFRNPAICIPIFGLKTLEPVAYQLKVLYQDPATAKRYKGRDSINQGPVSQGFAMIGRWGDDTRHAVLTEAWIDGASYLQQKRFGPDTVILPCSGSRFPEELIAECARRGIRLTTALDNDHAGRLMSKNIAAKCKDLGVEYADDVPGPSEFLLALKDEEKGKERYDRTVTHCMKHQVMFVQEPTKNGWIRMRIDNTAESAEWVSSLKEEERRERQLVGQSEETKSEKKVEVEVFNKDWNDLAVGGYQRSFSSEFERAFYQKLLTGPSPEEMEAIYARSVSNNTLPAVSSEPSAGVSIS